MKIKILSNFENFQCQNNVNLKKVNDFLQKLKKVVCIALYGLAISQSDCRKADLYQLPCNNALVVTLANGPQLFKFPFENEFLGTQCQNVR